MHLHRRHVHRPQRIVDGVAVMAVGAGIDDDALGAVLPCLLDHVDQHALMIGLHKAHLISAVFGIFRDLPAQLGIGAVPIYLRLPLSQQVQIGPIEN